MSQQELPLVALPSQEKIDFKTSKLSTIIWGKITKRQSKNFVP
jgi:hypothetical protein